MHLASLGPHGFPMEEATSELADPNNPKALYRYRADDMPTVDYVEKEQLDAAEDYRERVKRDTGQNANMHGLHFPVERIELNAPDER